MKIVSIHQPGYLPWLGFFKKIESADIFVFLDDVQYSRGKWENRNKIRTREDSIWLTVPILNKSGRLINQVEIDYSKDWLYKHKSAIKLSYEHSPFFDLYWNDIESILNHSHKKLLDLNMELINYFISTLEIKTKTVLSSDLNIDSMGSERLLDICMSLDADTYLSGELGVNYLDTKNFEKENIQIIFEKYLHPTYTQKHPNFISNMSIIDLLFNEGKKSIQILKESKIF